MICNCLTLYAEDSKEKSRCENLLLGRTRGRIVALCPLSLECTHLCVQYKGPHSSSPRTQNQSHRGLALLKTTAKGPKNENTIPSSIITH